MIQHIDISTHSRTELIDITRQVAEVIKTSKTTEGICHLYVPHTTAGLTINENADPSVQRDILMELNKMVPFNDNYSHSEGNASAHIKASLVGNAQTIFIVEGELLLGTWQGIYFCEFDGPRKRRVLVRVEKSSLYEGCTPSVS